MYNETWVDENTVLHNRTPVKAGGRIWETDNGNQPEWYDKAGGYAIQGIAAKFVKEIRGDYYNVVGLPMSRVYRLLREIGYIK